MAASCTLPATQDLSTLYMKLQGLVRFLKEALPISNAHTVDFYTESVWEQLVALPPERVLMVLRRSAADMRPLVECERSAGEQPASGPGGPEAPPIKGCGWSLRRGLWAGLRASFLTRDSDPITHVKGRGCCLRFIF